MINDALATRARDLQRGNDLLKKDLESANKVVRAYEAEKKQDPDLHTRLRKLESDREAKAAKIGELEKLLGTTEGHNAAALLRKYDRTWYVAVAGWAVGLFVTLGLLATLGQKPAPEPAGSAPEEPPRHRIT